MRKKPETRQGGPQGHKRGKSVVVQRTSPSRLESRKKIPAGGRSIRRRSGEAWTGFGTSKSSNLAAWNIPVVRLVAEKAG